MITEQELERALALKEKIRDLRVFISKLETARVSQSSSMNSKISIDQSLIEVNDYTIATLKRFHKEIVNDHKHRLHKLEEEYSSIIFSPEEAFEKALMETDREREEDGDNEER